MMHLYSFHLYYPLWLGAGTCTLVHALSLGSADLAKPVLLPTELSSVRIQQILWQIEIITFTHRHIYIYTQQNYLNDTASWRRPIILGYRVYQFACRRVLPWRDNFEDGSNRRVVVYPGTGGTRYVTWLAVWLVLRFGTSPSNWSCDWYCYG